jgi:ubiquitin carboxyl-terminal hydrolase 34
VARNWVRFQQYFEFWNAFARGGRNQTRFLVSNNFLHLLLDFFLGEDSPVNLIPSEKKQKMGSTYQQP